MHPCSELYSFFLLPSSSLSKAKYAVITIAMALNPNLWPIPDMSG